MWVFSDVGFFSVVEDWTDKDFVWVRTRWRKDLEQLREYLKSKKVEFIIDRILETPNRDYAFRIHIEKNDWDMILSYLGQDIRYGNFKEAIQDKDPEREKLYHRVWHIMRAAEKKDGYCE
ncbi:MAG: hypothetical protein KJ050_10505 [Candidatus Omnitrophica bacterium]|nr:hypothetical protein [Candidatus Omnitrophota bacterium]